VELVKHNDEESKMAALTKALGDEDVKYKKEDLAIVQLQTELKPPESGANPNQTESKPRRAKPSGYPALMRPGP
jgi:hypothetical protein